MASPRLLIIVQMAIGDCLVRVVPVAKAYAKKGYQVSCLVWQKPVLENLLGSLPYIEKIISAGSGELNLEEVLRDFDFIIFDFLRPLPSEWSAYFNKCGIQAIEPKEIPGNEFLFLPEKTVKKFGLAWDPELPTLSIEWFKTFERDFACGKNSVLLHCKGSNIAKSYHREFELRQLLQKKGYSVFSIDDKRDLRENLFLINQVGSVITVDTSILWMALALKKRIFCFQDKYPPSVLGLTTKMCLKVPLLPVVSPSVIVDKFIESGM